MTTSYLSRGSRSFEAGKRPLQIEHHSLLRRIVLDSALRLERWGGWSSSRRDRERRVVDHAPIAAFFDALNSDDYDTSVPGVETSRD